MATRIFYLFFTLVFVQGFYGIYSFADENDVLEPLRQKVAVAKTHYPELIDESFRALIKTHYLTLSANYFFATDQLNGQLEQSRQSLEEFQKSRESIAHQTPESPSFLDKVSKFSTIEFALSYEKSETSSLKKNLEDLALGWKNQCTNESIQKFVDWNDPKRMLHLGHIFRRTPIPPKNLTVSVGINPQGGTDYIKVIPSCLFVAGGTLLGGPVGGFIGGTVAGAWNTVVDLCRDKTGELRKEQESLLSELSQFYTENLERKQREAFSLPKEACHELFTLDFAEKLDQLILQVQAHENQIALEKASYDESWEKIRKAYSQFLLSREEEYFKELRENYLTRFDQTFSDVAKLDKQAKVFIETDLGPLADEFEQMLGQTNEAKALFKQRFWDALIEGDTQFHSGDQFYFANLEEMDKMIDRNFWHEFTGDLKPIFLFERSPDDELHS